MPRTMSTRTPDDELDLVEEVITDANRDRIRAVLADPQNAWRAEPRSRKIAHLRHRGVQVPDDAPTRVVEASLEREFGESDLVSTLWLQQGREVADAVALIRQPDDATGFLISDWLLMTNQHVFGSPDVAGDSQVLFRYEEDENAAINPIAAHCDPDRCFLTSPNEVLDYAIVALKPMPDGTPPGQRFGRIPLVGSVGKAVLGQPLNIIQHPRGRSRQIAFRNNKLLSLDDDRELVYQTDTLPGSSGSPVLGDRWQLVALHHASQDAKDADGVAVDVNGQPVTKDTPEYLRNWVANAGIRVSCLVKDLRERDLDPEVRALVDAALK
jgi:endonuclease G